MIPRLLLLALLLPAASAQAQFGGFNLDPSKLGEGASKILKGSTGIGIKEELAIGGSVAVEIVSQYGGIWKDEASARRINLIGKTLAQYSDRPELPFRFGLLDSPAVNAFSAPGGYIFITRGAYEAIAGDDDELAGVLAHEIIHVTRRHALRIISRNEFISGVSGVAAGTSADFQTYDLGVDKASQTLLKTGYDTGTEFDSDLRARELAANAGFVRSGLLAFLKKLQADGAGGPALFSTHPALKDRIARLSK
jgi:predicted Zn-dependent protease